MMYYFDSPWVYVRDIPEHQDIKESSLDQINYFIENNYAEVDDYAGGTITNFNFQSNPDTSIPLFKFNEEWNNIVIWNSVSELVKQLTAERHLLQLPVNFNLVNMWFNKYVQGSFARPHEHYSVDISGIYILHSEEPNPTVFKQQVNVGNWRYQKQDYTTEDVKEGSVILFPSHLTHWTMPCKSTRYIVSFDMTVEWMNNPSFHGDEEHRERTSQLNKIKQFMTEFEEEQ